MVGAGDDELSVKWFHLVFGNVCGSIGDNAGDGDNDTSLGVDACNTAYDSFERSVDDADRSTGTVVYLGIGDGIGLWHANIDKADEVVHVFLGNGDGGVGSGERKMLDDIRLVHKLSCGVLYDVMDVVVGAVHKEQVRT